MEKYLSPDNIEDYNKKEFWDKAFAKYMSKGDRILLVGCGNSALGEKLFAMLSSVTQ